MATYGGQRGGYGGAKRSGPRGRSYERIHQLKLLVDRIISDCSIESKEVRNGLQMIKDYQLDVLGEIKDIPEDDDERTYYAPRERDTYEPYSRQTYEQRDYVADGAAYSDPRAVSEVTNLREEKINLMNELNGEIKASNKLAHNYRSLQGDYVKLKREFERLNKRQKFDESSNEGQSIINKVPRDEGRRYYYDEAPVRQRESPESENVRLREELAQAYATIDRLTAANQELERKLSRVEQEIARLEKEGGQRRSPDKAQPLRREVERLTAELRKAENKIHNLEGGGDLSGQLALLKQQNEQLRVETIRLLKRKQGGGGGSSHEVRELQEQIIRLHSSIEKENEAKRQFIEDMDNYKRKFTVVQNENRQLKARLQSQGGVESNRYASSYVNIKNIQAPVEFKPRVGPAYDQMIGVIGGGGDSKLDKYRSVLTSLRTYGVDYNL